LVGEASCEPRCREDIDLVEGYLTVNRQEGNTSGPQGGTRRMVPMTKTLVDALLALPVDDGVRDLKVRVVREGYVLNNQDKGQLDKNGGRNSNHAKREVRPQSTRAPAMTTRCCAWKSSPFIQIRPCRSRLAWQPRGSRIHKRGQDRSSDLRVRIERCYAGVMTRRAVSSPRIATGKVVNGRVVTRAKFPEGTKLILEVDEAPAIVQLDAEDEKAIDRALTSVREGKGISLDKFRAILQRL
jgi:hypothetical protein